MERYFKFLLLAGLLAYGPKAYSQKDCSKPSSGFTPLTDFVLGDKFNGFTGGLYGNNSNLKPQRYMEDAMIIANEIKPLNVDGQVDPNGKIGFMAVGASNPRTEFNAFLTKIQTDSNINPRVKFINSCIGGQGIQKMNQANDNYWIQADKLIDSVGLTNKQIQVIWVETDNTANGNTNFPQCAEELADEYYILFKTIKQLYPNVKICYLASRTYAGFATPTAGGVGKGLLHPRDYFNGWANRFFIERLVNDLSGYDFIGEHATIPFVTWGNYSWTDGNLARKDGFAVDCTADFGSDGLHLSALGEQKIGSLIYEFFKGEETAQAWLFNTLNKVNETFDNEDVTISGWIGADENLKYYSKVGVKNAVILDNLGRSFTIKLNEDDRYISLSNLSNGMYWITFFTQDSKWTKAKPFVKL